MITPSTVGFTFQIEGWNGRGCDTRVDSMNVIITRHKATRVDKHAWPETQ